MDTTNSSGDGLENVLSRENTGSLVKALKEKPDLILQVQNTKKETGHLKLGPNNTLQAAIGNSTIAVLEHPKELQLTTGGIEAYRQYVRQRAEEALKHPYITPVTIRPKDAKLGTAAKPTKKPSETDPRAAETAKRQLLADLEKIFDTTNNLIITTGVIFSLLRGTPPNLFQNLKNAKFANTTEQSDAIRVSGRDVYNFLNPLCSLRRFRDLFQFFSPNTIIFNKADNTVTIKQTY